MSETILTCNSPGQRGQVLGFAAFPIFFLLHVQVGATSYNEGSSRSHTILRIAVESRAAPGSAAAAHGEPRMLSYLNLIDLAGSESARVRNAWTDIDAPARPLRVMSVHESSCVKH
jgi:hypothetical protein